MLNKRTLGTTELQVSPIGLGTVKFGRNTGVKYPQSFELPSDKSLSELLSLAQSLGVNLLDTAPAYGSSEQKLGQLLQGKRHEWILCSKVGELFDGENSSYHYDPQFIYQSVKNSLKQLNTDYLDILLVHSNGDDLKIIKEYEVFNTLDTLKKQGLIRYFGMSTKTVAGGVATVQQADIVMATYNPTYTDELPVLQAAQEFNKGVLIKKAFASGHLDKFEYKDPVAHALSFVYNQPAVSSIILGTINPQHLQENVAKAQKTLGIIHTHT